MSLGQSDGATPGWLEQVQLRGGSMGNLLIVWWIRSAMAEVTLDATDFEILQWLDREGDIDVEAVSEELDISTSTVYYRLDKYREQGILEGEISQLNAKKLGIELTAISEIKSQYGPGYEEIG